MKTKDKLVIGGHEFDSRFILGSGKYSMKLIEAAVRDAGAQIITLAVRRANTKDHENIRLYSRGCYSFTKYFRSEKCTGGGKNRTFGKRTWLWKLCKGRDYA